MGAGSTLPELAGTACGSRPLVRQANAPCAAPPAELTVPSPATGLQPEGSGGWEGSPQQEAGQPGSREPAEISNDKPMWQNYLTSCSFYEQIVLAEEGSCSFAISKSPH